METPAAVNFEFAAPGRTRSIRRRQYPALTIVIWICYILLGLLALSLCVNLTALATGFANSASINDNLDALPYAAGLVGMALAGLVFTHVLAGVMILATAESIKVIIDIQHDTHETAQLMRG